MDLQEALEVQVGDLLTILRAEELGELGVRDDAALHVRVEAVVALHVGGNELRHIRLAALRLGGETHEARQLIGDGAELEEGVVRTASLVGRTLLGGHRGGVLANTALGLASLTLQRLGCIGRLTEDLTNTGRDLRAQGTEAVLHRRQENIASASLNVGRGRDRSRNGRRGGGSDNRDSRDGGGGRGSLLGGGGLGGGLLVGGRHRVYIRGGLGEGHF